MLRKHQARNLEIPGSMLTHRPGMTSWLNDCYASSTERATHTGSAGEYFTWLSAKLDSIEAMPSNRVSLFFRNAS